MSYKEPGVYLQLINSRPNTGNPSALVPVIVGAGPAYMDHLKVPVVADASLKDVLPSSKVTAILGISLTLTGAYVDVSNYTFSAVDNSITWGSSAPTKPAAGTTYYVDYEARPEAIQYQATFIDSFDKLDSAYVGQLVKSTSKGVASTVNQLYLGAYLALESGATGVYCVQVEPDDKDTYAVVATDFTAALTDVVAFIPDAYQIVAMSSDSTVQGAVIAHVNSASAIEERKERVAFVAKDMLSTAANGVVTDAMATEIIGYSGAMKDKRVLSIFVPSYVTKTLSDGNIHQLDGSAVCAALAGMDSVIPVERALTRQKLLNFIAIADNKMTRAVKNKIAASGTIVLEQNGAGSPIVIRHGVTTDMSNVANREYSIIKVCDYAAKFLRNSLEGYIGTFNIDDFFITKVKGTLTSVFDVLKRNNKINDAKITLVAQDAENSDTLLVVVSIKPPYPCNYIDVTLVID